MDTLEDCMISSPLPCAHLVISDSSQMDICSMILSSGQAHTSDTSNRLFLRVTEDKDMGKVTPKMVNWLVMEVNEPTCIICCRDWQSYKLELKGTQESISDSSLVNVIPSFDTEGNTAQNEGKVEIKINKSFLMKGTLKDLEALIKEDIENCLSIYKEANSSKVVTCKFLFLILLNENLKTPNKAIAGLKNLNPNEVAAICVTCGLSDITIKLSKVEQLMYEISLSYYEKKIHKLYKISVGIKNRLQTNPNETDEIYLAITNFKMGFFSEFLSNTKDSFNKYTTCWNSIKGMNYDTNVIDKATIAFYTSLRMLEGYFTNSNVISALTFSLEIFGYMKCLIYGKYDGLYYNIMYLTNYVIANKLEVLSNSDIKNYTTLMQHAADYYKWALQFLIRLRKLLKTRAISSEDHFIPSNFGKIFFHEDMDFSHLYSETVSNDGSLKNENIQASEVLLRKETEKLIGKLLGCFSNFIWSNSFLQIYNLVGDSLLLSHMYKEALNIYLTIYTNIVNSRNLEADFILKECRRLSDSSTDLEPYSQGSNELKYIHDISALLLGEMCYDRKWIKLSLNIISKIIISLNILLSESTKIPPVVYDMADISSDIDWEKTKNDHLEIHEILFIKSIITLISLKSDTIELVDYLYKISLTVLNHDLKSYVILSKAHKCQYICTYNEHVECIDILINFHLDFPCEITTSEGFIDTTLGIIPFRITDQHLFDDIVVVKANSADNEGGKVTLPKDRSITLSLVHQSSYSKDDFRVLGLSLSWKINEIVVFCLIPSIYPYDGSVMWHRMIKNDGLVKLGSLTNLFNAPVQPIILPKYNYSSVYQGNRVMEIAIKSLEINNKHSILSEPFMDNTNVHMLRNSIKMDVFVDTTIRSSMTPVAFVFSYDRLFKSVLSNLKFFVETDSNIDLYILTDFCDKKFNLCKCKRVEFLMSGFIEYSGSLYGTCEFVENEVALGSLFTTSRIKNEVPNSCFLKDFKRNEFIFCIFGLIRIPTSGEIDIDFNFYCQANNKNSLDDRVHIAKENIRTLVHEPIKVSLTVGTVYDNENGTELKLFSIELINEAFLKYDIVSLKLLAGGVIVAENTDIFGFEEFIDNNQQQKLVYIHSMKNGNNGQFGVELVSSMARQYIYPFDFFKECCNITTSGFSECEDTSTCDIGLEVKHDSLSTLGEIFEVTAIIKNNSKKVQGLQIMIGKNKECEDSNGSEAFLLMGSRIMEVISQPGSSETVTWEMVPIRSHYNKVPIISILEQNSQANDIKSMKQSHVYVLPNNSKPQPHSENV